MSTNLAAVLHKINDIRMEDIPLPEPGENEVLLRMAKVGICGSDVHYWKIGAIGDFVVEQPMVLGHEAGGVVAKCGPGVTHLKEGDRVAIEPGVPCRRCHYCKTGFYNRCRDIVFCATPPVHGNLCRYYKHAADFCFKLPDHVSLEEAAMLEPLSVAVHASKRAGVTFGSTVLICGSGPIGLLTLMTVKAMGATTVCVTDLVEHKLAVAKSFGADATLLVGADSSPADNARQVAALMGGSPSVTLDCCGFEDSVQLALHATAAGGTVVVVGMGQDEYKVPFIRAIVNEVDLRGTFRYANCYPLALEMVASGKVDLKPMVTHRFKLEDSVKAFEVAANPAEKSIKVMISCE